MKIVKVTSITFLQKVNEDASVYMIEFDDNTSAHLMGDPSTTEDYLNKTVEVSFRKDIYNGDFVDFVDAIALQKVVNVIEREDGFKLYCENEDSYSTHAFADMEQNETYLNCILYCQKTSYDSSIRADWLDLTCSDRFRKIAHIKMFSPVDKSLSFAGNYIKCDLRRNKYGFTTTEIESMEHTYAGNPEVDIAEKFIRQQFAGDEKFNKFLAESNVLSFMREYIGYEKGSLLIDTAVCISIANEITNIVPNLDVISIRQAFVANKLWCIVNNPSYSRAFLTTFNCVKYKQYFADKVFGIIDYTGKTCPDEYAVFTKVKELALAILTTRKGDISES